jgi:hypothetical protein
VAMIEEIEPKHGSDCGCFRCTGTPAGNQLARKHGGYSMVGLGQRAAEIAEDIRPTLPAYSICDEPVVLLFAGTLARIERGMQAIEAIDEKLARDPLSPWMVEEAAKLQRLREDLRSWINTARRLANDLALTPTSRAKLGLDIALARRAADDALERLAAQGRRIREAREAVG